MDSVKRLIDNKIRRNVSDGNTIECVISDLCKQNNKFKNTIAVQQISKETKRYEMLNFYINWSDKRISDLEDLKRISSRFKLDNVKLLNLMEFKTKNAYGSK